VPATLEHPIIAAAINADQASYAGNEMPCTLITTACLPVN